MTRVMLITNAQGYHTITMVLGWVPPLVIVPVTTQCHIWPIYHSKGTDMTHVMWMHNAQAKNYSLLLLRQDSEILTHRTALKTAISFMKNYIAIAQLRRNSECKCIFINIMCK